MARRAAVADRAPGGARRPRRAAVRRAEPDRAGRRDRRRGRRLGQRPARADARRWSASGCASGGAVSVDGAALPRHTRAEPAPQGAQPARGAAAQRLRRRTQRRRTTWRCAASTARRCARRLDALARVARAGARADRRIRRQDTGRRAPIRSLSGGNVQRAVLARELSSDADLLLVANPVFGLDFAAVAEIHARLMAARNARRRGAAGQRRPDELLRVVRPHRRDERRPHRARDRLPRPTPTAHAWAPHGRHDAHGATDHRRRRHDPARSTRRSPSPSSFQPARRRWSSSTCSATSSSPAASAQPRQRRDAAARHRAHRSQRVLAAGARAAGRSCTRARPPPDLSDCPPAKRERGAPALRIGDAGPMGRILIAGEPGARSLPALAPRPGELVIDKPGKGVFYATALHATLQRRGITHLVFMRRHDRSLRADHHARGQRPRLRVPALEDATESYFPAFKAAALEMIVRAGRHRRLGRTECRAAVRAAPATGGRSMTVHRIVPRPSSTHTLFDPPQGRC